MLLLVPAQPVHQHSSANNAASLTPLMDSVGRLRQCFFVRKTIVVSKNDQNKNTIRKTDSPTHNPDFWCAKCLSESH